MLAPGELSPACERAGPVGPNRRPGPAPDGTVKVSAAWLIERAGFRKGYGGARASPMSGKHTLALTNRGTGTTAALLGLAREIRDGVRDRFEVELRAGARCWSSCVLSWGRSGRVRRGRAEVSRSATWSHLVLADLGERRDHESGAH